MSHMYWPTQTACDAILACSTVTSAGWTYAFNTFHCLLMLMAEDMLPCTMPAQLLRRVVC